MTFSLSRRTGFYKIVKETNIRNEAHYELLYEMTSIVRGTFWEAAEEEQLNAAGDICRAKIKFKTEEDVLMYLNEGTKIREVVRAGVIDAKL